MEVRNREQQIPFTTKDGSTIRSLLDASNAPVRNQSLAEASLPAGAEIERHYHKICSPEILAFRLRCLGFATCVKSPFG